MEKNNCIEVKDLVVEYLSGGRVIHAVNGVSFSLEQGKCLALVGETGAGKTTIAKSILRILPDPQGKIRGGTIAFDGKELLGLPDNEMRKVRGKRISMVFQDPMTALNPVKTIGDQIAEVIKKHDLIVVLSERVHCRRSAAHVHQYVWHFESSYGFKHRIVEVATRDVVNNLHAPIFHATASHIGSESIHRYNGVGRNGADNTQPAVEARILLFGRDVIGIRAR